MKHVASLICFLAATTSAFAIDQVEDLMTQITFAGKAGDTKVFSADAETMMEIGYKFPGEFANLLEGEGRIYWTQMRKLPNEETARERTGVIEARVYASNQLCKHPMCRQPEEADFRILTLHRRHTCSKGIADGGCSIELVSKGIATKRKEALFWLDKKAQND